MVSFRGRRRKEVGDHLESITNTGIRKMKGNGRGVGMGEGGGFDRLCWRSKMRIGVCWNLFVFFSSFMPVCLFVRLYTRMCLCMSYC